MEITETNPRQSIPNLRQLMKSMFMYLRKIKYKDHIYYYLTRKTQNSNQEERIATIGMLSNPTPDQELQLVSCWVLQLMSGGERASQRTIEMAKTLAASREAIIGKTFDIDQCLQEMRTIYLKYGKITKTILEKQARPNGELSWGTTTVLNQLRNRGLTLAQVFTIAKNNSD